MYPGRQAFVTEVKWGSRRVGRGAMDDLRARAARTGELHDLTPTFAIASRAGFSGKRSPRRDERFIDARKLSLGR